MKLKELKKKIETYGKFREVLKAIQMIAAADMGKVRKKLEMRYFAQSPFMTMFPNIAVRKNVDLFENVLIVALTLQKTCIGAHNYNIINHIKYFLQKTTSIQGMSYISLGWKAEAFFTSINQYKGFYFSNDEMVVKRVCFSLCYQFIKIMLHTFSSIVVIYNKFFNTFLIVCRIFLIPNLESFHDYISLIIGSCFEKEEEYNNLIVYVTSLIMNMVVNDFFLLGNSLLFLDCYKENFVSYISSRITAMTSSTKNVEEMHAEFVLTYNKTRQEKITTEIIEVSIHTII